MKRDRRWTGLMLFALFSLFVIGLHLLPMGLAPGRLAMPDILFMSVLAWIVRREEHVPMLLVAGIALIADVLMMRPFGLWPLLILIAAELWRANDRLIREMGWMLEWLLAAITFAIALLFHFLVLAISFSQVPGLSALMSHLVITVACYPVILLFLHYFLRIRKTVETEGVFGSARR